MHLESARELLKEMYQCAKKAKVNKYMFLGFGTMLGAIRGGSLISHDDDMDVCFLPMSAEEKERYFEECKKSGLMDGWPNPDKRVAAKPNGELLWFSAKKTEKSTRSCNWFFVEHENYMYHTKGKAWVSDIHFSPKLRYSMEDEAIMLGAPSELFKSMAIIEFEGGFYFIPSKAGTLCDEYYPDWFQPREGGSSAQNRIISVGKWEDENTWRRLI